MAYYGIRLMVVCFDLDLSNYTRSGSLAGDGGFTVIDKNATDSNAEFVLINMEFVFFDGTQFNEI